MAPKRKAATASSTKDTADAPLRKRKKTEVPEDGPAEASKAAAKATKSTVAKATKKPSTAAKPKPAASKAASPSKAKATTASKAKTAAKSTPAKAAAKPNTAVKVKAAASKVKATPKKKAGPKKAAKEEASLAAEKPKRSRAPTKKQEEADETAAEEAKPKTSKAAAKPTTAVKPKATAAKAQAASTQTAAANKAKATPKKAAAPKSRTTAAKKPAAEKATSKRSTKAEAEDKAEVMTEDEPEDSKPKAAAARKPAAAKKARVKKSSSAAEDEAEDIKEEEPEESKPKAAAAKKSAAAKTAPPKRTTKAATAAAEAAEEPKDMAEDKPEESKPRQVPVKRGRTAAAKKPAAEASDEPMDEPEVIKPVGKGARPARTTRAAPKEEVEEPDQAAPMEGVEAPAEKLEKPAAKGKAAAKPAAKRLAKRKAEEVEEAAEEEPVAAKEVAERPPKRRAVAKGKKAAEALQPVEHLSHQKEAGEVYVIGAGDCGQLGVGEDDVEALRARLSTVASGKQVVQVAAGGMHSVALTAEGEVYTCGVNDEGALGRETKGAPWENSPQATGNATDSYQWAEVKMPTQHGKIIQVSAGDSHTMALTEQGFIYGWGTFRNSSGVFSFSAQDRFALLPCLVYSPAAAACQAVKIVSGTDHVVALLRGGNLLSWGTGEQGQLGRIGARLPERGLKELLLAPAEVTLKRAAKAAVADPIVDIAAGNYSTFAVMKSGQVWSWGLNNYSQLAQESEAPVMAPRQAKELNSQIIAAVGPGQHHTLFLTQSGQLLSVGRPTYGRLGQKGVNTASDNPVKVPGDVHAQDTGLESATVASIVAGPEVSAAIGADGRAWVWGFGTNGQLGNGNDDSDKEIPSLLKGKTLQGKRVVQVDFGGQHTLLVVTGRGAGPSSAPPAAATTSAGPTHIPNGVAVGMNIDAPSQADGIHENGIMAGAGHAEKAADDGIAAAVPRQGDPLLQEASITAAPDAAPAEGAAQLPAAPAQPTGPSATDAQAAAPVTPQVDSTAAEAAPLDVPQADAAATNAPDDIPQVDVAAAAAAPAALTHSASGEHPPEQSMAGNGVFVPPTAPVPVSAPQEAAPVSVPAAAPMEQPVQAVGVDYPPQVGQAGGPGPADATAAAEAAAAAEVAQMVDSMINVPEPEKAMSAAQLDPAAAVPAQQMVGLDAVAMQSVQPGPQNEALNAFNAQTGLPEGSAPLSMPASVPGYVEPAPHHPSTVEFIARGAAGPASEAPAQKASDVDDWRESFYALSGSKPM